MQKILTVESMRLSDKNTIEKGVEGKDLMYRAGKGIFSSVELKEPVLIVAGCGNNAGDGFVLAELLFECHKKVEICLLNTRTSADGEYYLNRCRSLGIKIFNYEDDLDFSSYSSIVDAIFGTGFKGSSKGNEKAAIEKINKSSAFVLSVDINSGLNGNSGMGETVVHSDMTVSIGNFKPGHFLSMAKDVMKEKINVDIGISPCGRILYLPEREDIVNLMPKRKHFSNKGTYGYSALIGGSLPYSGAIRLSSLAHAAMRCGGGVVKIGVAKDLCPIIAGDILESTLFPLLSKDFKLIFNRKEVDDLIKNTKSVAFGMGIEKSEDSRKMLLHLLKNYDKTLIIDADGLNMLSEIPPEYIINSPARIILTPHVREFSRLSRNSVEDILENPIPLSLEYSKNMNAVLLLKGPTTIVTDGGTAYLIDRGTKGMATAGSGDVLSGILCAVASYTENPMDAAVISAYVNGCAGEIAEDRMGSISMLARDTIEAIPSVMKGFQ